MGLIEVKFKEQLGIVTSDTSSTKFDFFVTPLNNITLKEGDYVIVNHPLFEEKCPILSKIREIKNFEEVMGATLGEKGPKTIAQAKIIGCVDLRNPNSKPLHKLNLPPNPGSKVHLTNIEFIEDIFHRDIEGFSFEYPLHLGKLESEATSLKGETKTINFFFNAKDLMNHHTLIASMTGMGKTHTAKVIIEELANRTDYPVVILDPFGEYIQLGNPSKDFKTICEGNNSIAKDYPFNFNISIYSADPKEILGKNKNIKTKHITSIPRECLIESDIDFDIGIKDVLRNEINKSQIIIFDARGLSLDERKCFFNNYLRAIWQLLKEKTIKPFTLVVEDPINLETNLLKEIVCEGKKHGVTVCLLSQHPSIINNQILSQMGTQIIGRTVDPNDLTHLKNMSGNNQIPLYNLKIGEWIINGIKIKWPTKVIVRDYYSIH